MRRCLGEGRKGAREKERFLRKRTHSACVTVGVHSWFIAKLPNEAMRAARQYEGSRFKVLLSASSESPRENKITKRSHWGG